MKKIEIGKYKLLSYNKMLTFLKGTFRRFGWLMKGANARQYANLAGAAMEYGTRRERLVSWPVALKVDISPLCNLSCSHCVHARPSAAADEDACADQDFHAGQKMKLADFKMLLDQVAGKTSSVSLYYLGEPLMHPELVGFCDATRTAGLNSHISTNFSFSLSDQRLRDLITSGMTHITVCLDGMEQESYRKTRVGGNIEKVLDNLERLLRFRGELCGSSRRPTVEVQYIKFQHNTNHLAEAQEWCKNRGVDAFTHFFGTFQGPNSIPTERIRITGAKAGGFFPLCKWPWLYMMVKYNGDVIPCCNYRHMEQYSKNGDSHVVGNVFSDGVRSVWNSSEYRMLRRMIINPQRVSKESEQRSLFCDGCKALFDTDANSYYLGGNKYRWEDIYQFDAQDRVVRNASEV